MSPSRVIRVGTLARVEGEGALHLRIRDGRVRHARLKIFEPPRFFEAFLRGRDFREAPDITARICGICPIAYQMSAVHALESACGVEMPAPIRDLRRLIYCGEWIESHALHVFMLHLPDFLGYPGAVEMATDHRETVEMALALKKAGNGLLAFLGGREVHPINVRVGGFFRVPTRAELDGLRDGLERGRDAAAATVRLTAGLDFPDLERDYEFVALRHPSEYPLNEGRIVSNRGLDVPIEEFAEHFVEEHVRWSNALHGRRRGGGAYLVGPLARFALNRDRLSPDAVALADEAGLDQVCRNPFRSIVVRSVEMFWAFDEALRIIDRYEPPERPFVDVVPRAATGYGCSEAPRGLCWHRYVIDGDGTVADARIVPPTSQNQPSIEEDLRTYAQAHVDLSDDDLKQRCEHAIRNHDPCISCATHVLRLTVERS